jgi:hypothetical protein
MMQGARVSIDQDAFILAAGGGWDKQRSAGGGWSAIGIKIRYRDLTAWGG